jgi:hypothetical protein
VTRRRPKGDPLVEAARAELAAIYSRVSREYRPDIDNTDLRPARTPHGELRLVVNNARETA